MDGEHDGGAAQGQAFEGSEAKRRYAEQHEGEQAQRPQGHEDTQADGAQAVTEAGASNGLDYQAALRAKDSQIAELEGKVAEAAKSAEATEALNAQIAALKAQMEDERVEFALKAVGARSVKAARALLDEHDGDVAALVAAEPWLFTQADATSQRSSQEKAGATGLEPAGIAGGGDSAYMKRWEKIAGLTDESKEG